ncbi:hypothetical protein AURDEDRAFT_167696 [Auricularia subglabra TFB-10046 SS5]|nr:hypothetical protein AURDEDRAFT_167696 [Auricularia subglabra TFB-10046 SS5]
MVGIPNMSVVEDPPISNNDAPLGTLVVLSLDPVASVADMDEEASSAAAELPRGKYLALVFSPQFNAFAPLDSQPLAFKFCGIGHGPPLTRPLACLGLCPHATLPSGRASLEPSVPLPWPDCYLDFTCKFIATVTRIHLVPLICAVPEVDIMTIIRAESAARKEEGLVPDSGASGSSVDAASVHDSAVSEAAASSASTGRYSSHSPASIATSCPSHEHLERPHSYWEPPQMRPRVEIGLDVGAIAEDDFRAPSEIIVTLVKLYTIEEEWATRAAAALMVDRPRTNKWAEDVAAANPLRPQYCAFHPQQVRRRTGTP